MMLLYIICFLFFLFIIIFSIASIKTKKKASLYRKHVVITGGSSGIGKELAILAAKKGANITLIARNRERLRNVADEIKKTFSSDDDQIVIKISSDVSDYKDIRDKLLDAEYLVGPVYMLINCAGYAQCGEVEDFSVEDAKRMMDVNYFGTLYPIQVLLPKFKERKEGIIVLTASQAALVGLYGYSVYSSCKFALRGLAEALAMEVKPYNVSVTLALPPDTDTPGFEVENKSKPLETHLISSTGGLRKPEEVASQILEDALYGKFFSVVGFESFILTTLCAGMSPMYNVWELLMQIILLGPLRLIGVVYLYMFNNIVNKCHLEKQEKKEDDEIF